MNIYFCFKICKFEQANLLLSVESNVKIWTEKVFNTVVAFHTYEIAPFAGSVITLG